MTTPQQPGPDDRPAQPPYGNAPAQPPYGSAPGAPHGSAPGGEGATPPPVTFEGQTFPGVPQQPEVAPREGRRGLVVGAVAVVTVGLVGTAVAASSFLSGGGTQPEDVLPSGAFAFAKLDLDPAAGQKVALYRLAQKFPDVEVSGEESIKDDLLATFFEGSGDIDYATQVKPWIGDRAGVGAFPDGDDEGDEPDVLAAFAYSDRKAAEAALPDLLAAGGDSGFYAFSEAGDFVLIGESQQSVDAAADSGSSLADDDGYGEALGSLEGDQIATVWADLEAVWAALPDEEKGEATGSYGEDFALTGEVVVGMHADASFLEVSGKALGVSTGVDIAQLGTGEGSGMLRQFPDDLLAGLSATGVGDALTTGFEDLRSAVGDETVDDLADQLGLTLPDDLRVLLGDELAVGLFGSQEDPSFVARTRTRDPAAALSVAEKLAGFGAGLPNGSGDPLPESEDGPTPEECDTLAADGFAEEMGLTPEELAEICPGTGGAPAPAPEEAAPLAAQEYEDGIAIGSSDEALARITTPGTLGSSPAFQQAVPDAASASVVLYADLARLIEMFVLGDEMPDLGALRAVGMTAEGGEDGAFRLRVTVE